MNVDELLINISAFALYMLLHEFNGLTYVSNCGKNFSLIKTSKTSLFRIKQKNMFMQQKVYITGKIFPNSMNFCYIAL